MAHLPPLISDLAVILLAAGFITLLFKAIKQPVVLGYVLAGIIAGPSLNLFHVTDIENIKTWAEIGVIFLLFSLGLDFSFKKLFKTGRTSFITAFTIVSGMLTLGYLTGKLLDWSHIDSLFLGGMLAMSSTTIIIKSFDDLGLKTQLFAGLVIGVLIVEDLVAVVLMVLLSTISTSNNFDGADLVLSILRMGMFILLWFVSGIYLLPTFLKKTKRWMNDETLLVVVLALCLGMVLIATKIGFSAALGAFVMGSLLAETLEAEKIEHLTRPVKDFFGAIFFVSVGMMINPLGLGEFWFPILIITLVVIFGQIIFATTGMILSGQPLKVCIQSSFSLTQIGEFAFIIATLGLSLNVIDKNLYPIIVAVSIITTFFTPFFIKSAVPVYHFISHNLPAHWLKAIHRFSASPHLINTENMWLNLLKNLLKTITIYLAITLTIMFLGFIYLVPLIAGFVSGISANILSAGIIILAMAPFLRAIMIKKNRTIRLMLQKRNMSKGPLITLISARIIICIGLVMIVIGNLFDLAWFIILLIALLIISFTIFSKWLKKGSIRIENRFLSNLSERQKYDESLKPMKTEFVRHLLSRDIHLADFEIQPHSQYIGKPLKDLHIREDYGVNIVSIIRGEQRINIPNGDEMLFPYDRIVVVGTDQQLMRFNYLMEEFANSNDLQQKSDVVLEQMLLEDGSKLIGKTIQNASLRRKFGCMVIGIERGRSAKMNPDTTEKFELNDILWLVGEKDSILRVVESCK